MEKSLTRCRLNVDINRRRNSHFRINFKKSYLSCNIYLFEKFLSTSCPTTHGKLGRKSQRCARGKLVVFYERSRGLLIRAEVTFLPSSESPTPSCNSSINWICICRVKWTVMSPLDPKRLTIFSRTGESGRVNRVVTSVRNRRVTYHRFILLREISSCEALSWVRP